MSENEYDVSRPEISFAGLPVCTHLNDLKADVAIVGLHYISPYPGRLPPAGASFTTDTAPDAIRCQSSTFTDYWDHFDFDFNDVLLAGRNVQLVDCGDVDRPRAGRRQNPERITAAFHTILDRGALPIVLGTDEGGLIPVTRAYDRCGGLCVVHIDAHIDWRDERHGVREGYSSVMRRCSEMPWVQSIVHAGLRGIGSARKQEVDDALAAGDLFVRARDIRREGIAACVEKIPAADHYLISIDADALDLAIAPGVLYPTPGGLTFDEVTDLVRGVADKGPIAGVNLFEIRPELDINGLTAKIGAQLVINFIETLVHCDQVGT